MKSKCRDVASAGVWKSNTPDTIGHMSISRTQEVNMTNDREGAFKNAMASYQVHEGLG